MAGSQAQKEGEGPGCLGIELGVGSQDRGRRSKANVCPGNQESMAIPTWTSCEVSRACTVEGHRSACRECLQECLQGESWSFGAGLCAAVLRWRRDASSGKVATPRDRATGEEQEPCVCLSAQSRLSTQSRGSPPNLGTGGQPCMWEDLTPSSHSQKEQSSSKETASVAVLGVRHPPLLAGETD